MKIFFSDTGGQSLFSVRDGAFPHHQLWHAACILRVLESIFPSPRASGLNCGGSCISVEEWQDVQPTLETLFANTILLGTPLTEQHHFCTSKLSRARDTILGYLGDTEWCFLPVHPVLPATR